MTKNSKISIDWKALIKDMLLLIAFVSVIGVACQLGMACFERKSPSEDLVSIVSKNQMDKEGVNTFFIDEIKRGKESDPNFVNCQDGNLVTPLMWVSYVNFNSIIEATKSDLDRVYYLEYLLAEPNIDIKAKDIDGFTSLHWAAWSGLRNCSSILVREGAAINDQENNGYTPLMLAAMRGNCEVVNLLLDLGASTELTNNKGQTTLQLAEEKEKAYSASSSLVYTLIYREDRDLGHIYSVKLLKAESQAQRAEILAEYQKKLQAVIDKDKKNKSAS